MNRKQRRNAARIAKSKGFDPNVVLNLLSNGVPTGITGGHTPYNPIKNGDKVMIDIETVKNRREWDTTLANYKDFVENSEGKTYTAIVEDGGLVTFKEDKRWLFWCGDLKIVERVEDND